MNNSPMITEDQVDEVIATGDVAELRRLLVALISKKQSIQIQLAESKNQMMAVRAHLTDSGSGPREAQVQATATTDHEWRGRATTAVLITDKCIARVRARIHELGQQPTTTKAAKPEAATKPRAPAPMRRVDVLRGTPEEIAKELQEFVSGGWSATSTIVMPDGTLIAMFRGDYVPEASP